MLGLSFIDNSEARNNIFYSGVDDTSSYAIGPAWTQPSYSVVIDGNVFYNLINLVDPKLTGYTETNTQRLNPNINPATGCASAIDNNTYGANLDVSQIPYRRCDGALHPFASKFGGGGDTLAPAPPTNLTVQ